MAEDRRLEPSDQLLKLCERDDVYARFMRDLCRKADEKYNSGLFHFQKEHGTDDEPDRITPKLAVDDKVIKPILQSLYFAHGSPYHFGVMPVEILGTVYERFLGKVIRLTAGHQAKVEEKPEVRKAGGVYYTPKYIVDYIVEQTVGRQIAGRSPMQLAGLRNGKQPLRVLDMACGSGSFLLGAYQRLLDHCLKWYSEHSPARHKQAVYKDPCNAHWLLTIGEKKRILTTHIFGVDIDAQAVEVTKLSLLLRVLEGETDQSVSEQQRLFHDRALPNLANNIKCGNSLIGPEYFTGKLISGPEEMRRVNPFDWKRGFPDAMKAGGFDCVIGNPPYGAFFTEQEMDYVAKRFGLYRKVMDSYVAFVQQGHTILRTQGRFGFIIPSAWLGGPRYRALREYLLAVSVESVILLPFDVFGDAYIDTLVLTTLEKDPTPDHKVLAYEFPKKAKLSEINVTALPVSSIAQSSWKHSDDSKFVVDGGLLAILTRVREAAAGTLGQILEMKRGVLFDRDLLTGRKSGKHSHPYFEGDVYRYHVRFAADRWVEYGPKMREYPKEFRWFEGERLLLRRLVNRQQRLMAASIEKTIITNKNLYVIKPTGVLASLFTLGILNSRLVSRLYLSQMPQATKDDFPQLTIRDVVSLPIPLIDLSQRHHKRKHDRIVSLVDSMLSLHKHLAAAKSEAQRMVIQRQIDATDAEIDRLVYDLYGLTAEEIAVVEGSDEATLSARAGKRKPK